MDIYQSLAECEGFEWDKGNILKSWEKHKVSASECEQIFFNIPLIAAQDVQHSQKERVILRLVVQMRDGIYL